jgi:co-chaperonin GroES (HSP10)
MTKKLEVLGEEILLKVDEPKAGALSLDSMKQAKEVGTVVQVGPDVYLPLKKGDRVLFKAWACDIIEHEGEKYIFITQQTNGIKAIIK